MALNVLVNREVAKRMKPGVTIDYLRTKYPGKRFEEITEPWPTDEQFEAWVLDSVCGATDGCEVEPDGECPHGHPSWLIAIGVM